MADNDNVIPFAPRAKARDAEGKAGARKGSAAPGTSADGGSTDETPIPGRLVWLHCPTCGTLEYSEVLLPGGRAHKCGSLVNEQEVELDLRAEYTLANYNLERLQQMAHLVEAQVARFTEYQQRLSLAAREQLHSYELTPDRLQQLPVAAMDPAGALVSPFLHDPIKRFPPETRGGAQLDEEVQTHEPEAPEGSASGGPAPTESFSTGISNTEPASTDDDGKGGPTR